MLGEKADSRLFQSLRERRGLCYSVQSEFSTLADTGLLTISVGLDAKHLRAALGLIRREIDRLCDQPIGARETTEARDYLIGQHRLGLESTTNQMMWLGESLLGHGRIVPPADVEAAFAEIDACRRATPPRTASGQLPRAGGRSGRWSRLRPGGSLGRKLLRATPSSSTLSGESVRAKSRLVSGQTVPVAATGTGHPTNIHRNFPKNGFSLSAFPVNIDPHPEPRESHASRSR